MFIVVEGTDGAGTGTQSEEVGKALAQRGVDVTTQEFPDHDFAIYRQVLHPAMHGEYTFEPDEYFLLFLADQLRFRPVLREALGSEEVTFIADRYFTTNLLYNCSYPKLKGYEQALAGSGASLTVDEAVGFALERGIVVPDKVVFLDVDVEVSLERKQQEEGHEEGLDRYESNTKLQKELQIKARYIAEQQLFGEWVFVDGNGTIEEVTQGILDVV